jgi:uncharacterized membrane protein
VPHVTGEQSLSRELLHEWPSFFGFGLSFIYIGIMWMNHHDMFRDIERVDHWLLVSNLLLLLSVSFVPFSTAVLAENLENSDALLTATLLYGGTATVSAIFFNAIWLHAMTNRERLMDDHISDARLNTRTKRYIIGPFAYGITLPIAFVTPWAALALYVAYAVLYLLPVGDPFTTSGE